MVAATKIEQTELSPRNSSRLMSLLLDKNYKKHYPTTHKIQPVAVNISRIEAEYEMEKVFVNML